MLPYSPLHHLLLDGVGRPLVMTSGNLSDEPIAHDDADAIERLGPMVGGLLTHDRPIHIRCDDSVARAAGGRIQLLRRSRGHAPEPLPLPFDTSSTAVLAVGAELKSTVAVTKGRHVVASHHIGDLEHLATYRSFLQAVDHLPRLYGVVPEVVAHDLHPEYLSTKFALELGLATIGVQHHHAHAASCLVEHGRTEAVLAICFDGVGYGTDGTLWGGELLVADLSGFRRVGHLAPVVMPGGVAAIREPWRMAAAWLRRAVGPDAAADRLQAVDERAAIVVDLVERGTGPTTTAVGRLFDAVAAALGGRPPRHVRGAGGDRAGSSGPDGAARGGAALPRRSRRDHTGRRRRRVRPGAAARRARRRPRRRRGDARAGGGVPRGARHVRRRAGRIAGGRARPRRHRPHRRRVPERPVQRRRRVVARRLRRARPRADPGQRRRDQHRPGRDRRLATGRDVDQRTSSGAI